LTCLRLDIQRDWNSASPPQVTCGGLTAAGTRLYVSAGRGMLAQAPSRSDGRAEHAAIAVKAASLGDFELAGESLRRSENLDTVGKTDDPNGSQPRDKPETGAGSENDALQRP
jgi:hypothetical protein